MAPVANEVNALPPASRSSRAEARLSAAITGAEQARRDLERQLLLAEATGDVLTHLDLDTLYPTLVEAACRITGARAGVLRVREGERGTPECHWSGDIGHSLLAILRVGGPPPADALYQSVRLRARRTADFCMLPRLEQGFDAADDQMLDALCPTAAIAIDAAYRLAEVTNRQIWLQASTDVSELLREAPDNPMELMLRAACQAAGADQGYVAGTDPQGNDIVTAFYSPDDGRQLRQGVSRFRIGDRTPEPLLVERALARGRPLITQHDWYDTVAPDRMLVAPVVDETGARAALLLTRSPARRRYTEIDLLFVENFVDHAVLSLKLTQAREGAARMLLLEERDKIARDLQDHVIARLFSTGLALERIAQDLDVTDGQAKLLARIGDIDDTIREIRSSVFQLNPTQGRPPDSASAVVVQSLLSIAAEWEESLGFAPELRFSVSQGKVPNAVADDLRAVIREALSNIARHAHATAAWADLVVDGAIVQLTVRDNGVGLHEARRSSGLENLRRRADRWRGTFEVHGDDGGTTIVWSVPTGLLP